MREFWEKHGLRLLIAVTAAAVLLSVVSYLSSTSSLLHNAAGIITSPFRAAATSVSAWAEDRRHYFADYTALKEENAALRAEVAKLREKEQQAELDSAENVSLRELLNLRSKRRDFVFEAAYVLDRQSTNWTSALTLNRGTQHDIARGDCVISPEGYLIGIVTEVGLNWCTVLTVIDTDTELGGSIYRTGELAIAEGDLTLMGQGKLKLDYLPGDVSLLSGDYVLTSGIGGYYPSGLVIGVVESVKNGDNGLAQYAILSPMVDFSSLSEVFIIKDYEVVD